MSASEADTRRSVRNDRTVVNHFLRRVVPPRLRYFAWNTAAYTPGLFELYLNARPSYRHLIPNSSTAVVIDGFPRCGNTYSTVAFAFANPDVGPMSHHLHTPRSIELAAKHQVPTLVVVRDPAGVLSSVIQFARDHDSWYTMRSFRRYYNRIIPLLDHIVLADFEEITSDFGSVITRLNLKYGTSFTPYVKTPENEAAVMAGIDQKASVFKRDQFEHMVSRPSEQRLSTAQFLDTLGAAEREDVEATTEFYRSLRERAGI